MNNIFGTIKTGTAYFICIVNCGVMIIIRASLVEGAQKIFYQGINFWVLHLVVKPSLLDLLLYRIQCNCNCQICFEF